MWVIGRYSGERAKSVLAYAEAGVGYFEPKNLGTKTNPDVIVAFLFVDDELPEHLTEITDLTEIARLDKLRKIRMGISVKKQKELQTASTAGILAARNIFNAVKNKTDEEKGLNK